MKNLKRIFSLALVGTMLAGMLTIGASAVDFTDADEISHTEAVNTLVSLGVINGKDTGAFDPEGTVTRAEMAKMITVALNGGKDFKYGVKATPTYTDIKGHWAESYIEYCTSLGIIAGQGNGTFAPDATVTGSAAAKMILVAIGYNAEDEGMIGIDWEINTNRIADNKGLYKEMYALNVSEGLSRDNAAQMIFNGCDAEMVEYDYRLITENGVLSTKPVAKEYDDKRTIFSKQFELLEGVGMLQKISYDKESKEYQYTVKDAIDGDSKKDLVFKSTNDFTGLYGMNVKALYKVEGKKTVAYGMFDNGDTTVVTTLADVTDVKAGSDKFKIAGTEYTLAQDADKTPVYVAPEGADLAVTDKYLDTLKVTSAITEASALVFVGEDSSKIDYVVLTPAKVAKVTFVGSSTINAGGSYDLEDDVVEEGLEKNDYVKVVAKEYSVHGVNTVTKLDTITGTVDATRSGETKIDGTWYNNAEKVDGDELKLGEEFKVHVIGKTIFAAEQISESATLDDVLVVYASDETPSRNDTIMVDVYYTDGTKQTDVKVTKLDGKGVKKKITTGLYTYKVKDGGYELTTVDPKNLAGTDKFNGTQTTVDSKKIGDFYIDDEAAIIVTSETDGTKFYTGAEAKKWSKVESATITLLADTVRGMDTAKVAFISVSGSLPSKVGDLKYGFVLSKPEVIMKGDEKVASYTVWTADGEIDVLDKAGEKYVAKKGEVISFKDKGNDEIDEVTILSTADHAYALTGIAGKDLKLHTVEAKSASYKLDDDTVILYVDTKSDKGVDGGELDTAVEFEANKYILNVWAVERSGSTGDNRPLDLIVYDVANDLDNLKNEVGTGVTKEVK